MKKFALLFALAALLASCIFESDDDGVNSWLASHSMPDNYKLQVLNIENLKPISVEKFWYDQPRQANDSLYVTLGRSSNVSQNLFLEFGYAASDEFIEELNSSDSVTSSLSLYWYKKLYKSKHFPEDSLPIEETLNLSFSWKLDYIEKKKALDSIADTKDSAWLESLKSWEPDGSADTSVEVSYDGKDSLFLLPLPEALVKEMKKMTYGVHLQLKISAPEANHMLRFYSGASSGYPMALALMTDTTILNPAPSPFRVANYAQDMEECSECPILHGAVRDSLVVELPAEPILNAIDEFYKEDTLVVKGNGYDVRQAVILARLTMARDDSKGNSEFGLPIQVVVSSYADSADTVIRELESYRLNKDEILEDGHQNLVFTPGDSLRLQITNGFGELLNKGDKDGSIKFIVKMGFPLLDANDTAYSVTSVSESDTNNTTFFTELDYARYDFSTSVENPMSLKLWLASKRGGK